MEIEAQWQDRLILYLRWIVANALGELFGLGATFAIGIGLFSGLAESPGLLPTLLTAALMTASGMIEGGVVGWLQWQVLQRSLPEITRRHWIRATVIGAVIAWFCGSLPMTFFSLSAPSAEQSAQEPDTDVMLLMFSLMGLVAGLILAYPQWRQLKRWRKSAWTWLPANALAWGMGMPLIFSAVDKVQAARSLLEGVWIFALHLLVTGALAGAVHGLVLVWMISRKPDLSALPRPS